MGMSKEELMIYSSIKYLMEILVILFLLWCYYMFLTANSPHQIVREVERLLGKGSLAEVVEKEHRGRNSVSHGEKMYDGCCWRMQRDLGSLQNKLLTHLWS
ncbi:hypothetical protein CDAR_247791 [Caerostris darwini]|uniref:Uncharacterized protein n=1 Tax=Caerostris darwini TaxID=1538125 RepID=A0AAV4RR12_9ARAC|nr:hypothetical protein CDAR_247791 [Caerostris darwini]